MTNCCRVLSGRGRTQGFLVKSKEFRGGVSGLGLRPRDGPYPDPQKDLKIRSPRSIGEIT